MSDMGDYFREWREHRRDCKAAEASGVSLREYRKRIAIIEKEDAEIRKQQHIERCTILCECGRWFLDKNAHDSHKSKHGRKGHKAVKTKESVKKENPSWAVF